MSGRAVHTRANSIPASNSRHVALGLKYAGTAEGVLVVVVVVTVGVVVVAAVAVPVVVVAGALEVVVVVVVTVGSSSSSSSRRTCSCSSSSRCACKGDSFVYASRCVLLTRRARSPEREHGWSDAENACLHWTGKIKQKQK